MRKRAILGLAVLGALIGVIANGVRSGAAPKVYKFGDKIADFALKDEQGKTVRLSQFKNNVVSLTFYASW